MQCIAVVRSGIGDGVTMQLPCSSIANRRLCKLCSNPVTCLNKVMQCIATQ